MQKRFQAYEYTKDDEFIQTDYMFVGDEEVGWDIFRNNQLYLHLGKGYKLLKTKVCGICSTDIDRRFLPFPLPQITGHELIAEDEISKIKYAVEINDTDSARNEPEPDIYCRSGIPTHSPTRLVVGIDRLPGGFSPYVLAPIKGIVPTDSLSDRTAVLTEPFAAALQAVTSSPPKEGSQVAVLGPRRLGSLLIAALVAYRKSNHLDFKISALVRHEHLKNLALELGADEAIHLKETEESSLIGRFSILYDTTSTTSGFELALRLKPGEIHLKTTNGQEVTGIKKFTELVVDELSILPFSAESLNFHWPNEDRKNKLIYVSPTARDKFTVLNDQKLFHAYTAMEASQILKDSYEFQNRIPRFDLAIVTSPEEIDSAIRPDPNSEESLVRPRGAILVLQESTEDNAFLNYLREGGKLRSSRCGDFHHAIQLLKENPNVAKLLSDKIISHEFSAEELPTAFLQAKDSNSIKVIIHHS